MASLKAPTLILWGARDTSIPVGSGRWFQDHIPGATLRIYPGLGHSPMEEDAAQTIDDLMGWLGKQNAPSAQK